MTYQCGCPRLALALEANNRDNALVAVLLEFTVGAATHDQFNEMDDRVGETMLRAGGPPPGLMAHVAYPAGDGFVVAEVWSTEVEGQTYVSDVLTPLAKTLGLEPSEARVRPVWSFARP